MGRIIETLTQERFIDRFLQSEDRKTQFTVEALKCIFEHLEETSDAVEDCLEFDLVGICCEYSEYRGIDGLIECDPHQHGEIERDRLEARDAKTIDDIPADCEGEFWNEVNDSFVDYMTSNYYLVEFTYNDGETGFLMVG